MCMRSGAKDKTNLDYLSLSRILDQLRIRSQRRKVRANLKLLLKTRIYIKEMASR